MITENQLEAQVRLAAASRRHHVRPSPPRGLVYRGGEIIWEKSADAAWGNVTHYRLYVDSENNLVREVSSDQTHIGDIISAKRVFVSSYNSNSGLESQKLILNTPVGIGIAIPNNSLLASKFVQSSQNLVDNAGFDSGDNGSWTPVGLVFYPPPDNPLNTASTWSVVNDSQGRNGPWTAKHVPGALGNDSLENDAQISCNIGDQFILSGYAKSSSGATNGTMFLVINFFDYTGANVGSASASVAGGSTSYARMIFSIGTPATAVTARVRLQVNGHTTGTWYVDDISCVPVIPSTSLDIDQLSIGPNGTITLSGFTWTPNSPSAGKIAWSSGFVSYQGNLYQIAAGNSSTDFWIYWQLSNPTVFQHAAQGTPNIPAALGSDDFIVALNNGGGATIDLAINLMRLSDAGHRAILTSSSLFFVNTSGKIVSNFGIGGAEQGRVGLWDSTQNAAKTISIDTNVPSISVGGVVMNVP